LLKTADGKSARIKSIKWVPDFVEVFNLEAGYFHNFILGDGLVVHNSDVILSNWDEFKRNPVPLPTTEPNIRPGDICTRDFCEITIKNTKPDVVIFRGTSIKRLGSNGELTWEGVGGSSRRVGEDRLPFASDSAVAYVTPWLKYSELYSSSWGSDSVILETTLGDLFKLQKQGIIGRIYSTTSSWFDPEVPRELVIEILKGKDVGGVFKYYTPDTTRVCVMD